jgi:hypothetical protein
MNQIMLNGVQSIMNDFMSGIKRGMELNRQRQQIQQQQSQKLLREQLAIQRRHALAAQKAMERNRRSLAKARDRISESIRSMSETGMPVRPVLQVREVTGAFGMRTLSPRSTGTRVEMDSKARVSCGQALLQASATVAANGTGIALITSLKEAAFLSRQARAAVTSGNLQVECPDGRSQAGELMADAESADMAIANETIKQQAELFAALYDRVSDNMQRVVDMQGAVKKSAQAWNEARQNHEQAQQKVKALEAKVGSRAPGTPSTDPTDRTSEDITRDSKRRALKEALAALRESEKVLEDVKDINNRNVDALSQAEKNLNDIQDLTGKIRNNPSAMPSLRQALGLPKQETADPKG